MNRAIAVFNRELKLTAFVVIEGKALNVHYHDSSAEKELGEFLKSASERELKAHIASFDNDGTERIGSVNVSIGDDKYAEALCLELEDNGFYASPTSVLSEKLLLLLSAEGIERSEREKILGDLLNLSDEEVARLNSTTKDIQRLLQGFPSTKG